MFSSHAAMLIAASAILKEAAYFASSTPQELTDVWNPNPSTATYLVACCDIMVRHGISYAAIQEVLKISLSTLQSYRDTYAKWGNRDTLLIVTHEHLINPSGWFHTRIQNSNSKHEHKPNHHENMDCRCSKHVDSSQDHQRGQSQN